MSALNKFSHRAARSYLQSAVFIDDHIFDQQTGVPGLEIDAPPQRKKIFHSKSTIQAVGKKGRSDGEKYVDDLPFHPKDLVSSFAREGITCALYEPQEGFSTDRDSEIFKLCERPDIIILDWDFSGDRGESSLDLIVALVKQSADEFPHHTRLISIYTTDQSLVAIANHLADRLKKEGLEANPEGAQCRLRSGAARLVVLGKPISRFGDEDVRFTVREKALANKLIDEFVEMNSGILPAYALHGLASIRKNSKRILDRFHGNLDGAFLLHRELVAASEEAFDQLPDLLAEEIRAVVEDERLSASESSSIAKAALKRGHVASADKDLVQLLKDKAAAKTVAKKLNVKGVVPAGHLSLASLFSSRTQYSSAAKRLCFGTVVRFRKKHSKKADEWKYAVCLVPSCDSLRLKHAEVRFPFWTVEVESYSDPLPRNGMVLELKMGQHISLSAGGKAGDKLWTDSFIVEKKTKTVVAQRTRTAYKYCGSQKTVEWVGQLKPLHAHRIAHSITDGLSRIGVCEAEWLRLICDR